MILIFVENRSSPVLCPDCGEPMSKTSFPEGLFPELPENGAIVTKYLVEGI